MSAKGRDFLMAVFTVGCIIIVGSNYANAQLTAEFSVKEESPRSFLVGNIASSSGLQTSTSPGDFATFRYNILDSPDNSILFSVNRRNGNVYTARKIDRELECGLQETCAMEMKVAVFSSVLSRFEVASVRIVIEDINDNMPIFPTDKVDLKIPESAVVGTSYNIDSATDRDSSSLFAVNGYILSPDDSPFQLNITQGPGDTLQPSLILKQSLDREIKGDYNLTITAYDGGSPKKSGTLSVKVKVLDENDNAPVFRKSTYDLSVAENTIPGTSLMRVSAKDLDSGDNADVRYRFGKRQEKLDKINKYFDLDSKTGTLTLKKEVVYLSGETISINVDAIDNGQPPRVGQTTILVKVADVGNNPPNVDINFLSSVEPNGVTISEATSVGTLVAFVTAEDLDSGDNGLVTCSLNDTTFVLQRLESDGYLIVTRSSLDREKSDVYYVSLECRDHGTPEMVTSNSFIVKVMDENDNKPIFSKDVYYATVNENNRISEFVTKVSATDFDIDENAEIKYSVHNDAQGNVNIDSKTGIIKAIRKFDREIINQYNFSIYATDGGNPSQTGSATVVMTIGDLNDNAPVFKVDTFQFFVLENMASGIKVGRLSATDADFGVNQNILYTAVEGSLQKLPFAVYQDGTVRTTEQLDRETVKSYSFLVRAFDLGIPSLSSTATVVVRVADENDNEPMITFPAKSNQTIVVPFPTNHDNALLHIQAFDVDENGPNSYLTYTIIEGNEMDVFEINENSGAIYLKQFIDILKDEKFRLKISVKDNGYHPHENIMDIAIVLKRFNETDAQVSMDADSRNAIVVTAVITLIIIGCATIITIVCIVRRNAQKLKKQKQAEIESNTQELLKQKNLPVPFKNISSVGTTTNYNEKMKSKVSFADDEDLRNMELYNSTGTSMFTDTLVESQKMVTSAEEESYSDDSAAHDSGRGGSYLDVYQCNQVKTLCTFGPKPAQVSGSAFPNSSTLQHLEIL